MAVRNIITWGDPRLKMKNNNIEHWNQELDEIVKDLFDTLVAKCGVGLAAPQVGINLNIAVVDTSCGDDPTSKILLINPKILNATGLQSGMEGCLSVPGTNEVLNRPKQILVKNYKTDNSQEEFNAEDFLARVMCHEIDHLNGRLFIEHLGPVRRQIVQRQYNKQIKNR